MGILVTSVVGFVVGAFLSSLWVFHVFFSETSKANATLPTIAYLCVYFFISLLGNKTFLRGTTRSFDEFFVFFNFIPVLFIGIIWSIFYLLQ